MGKTFRIGDRYLSPKVKRDNGCIECGDASGHLHTHHIVPRRYGGEVVVVLCEPCHNKAHGLSADLSRTQLVIIAMNKKKAAGEFTGIAPFGSQLGADGISLEASQKELAAIEFILKAREEGASIRGIASMLNASDHEPRGERWHPTTVARVLKAWEDEVGE